MSVTSLTDADFVERVEQAQGVVVVDFWAPWCMPCKLVGPVIEGLARAFDGQVTVGKLNVDENPLTAERYHIKSIPTVGIFRDGRLVNSVIGVRPERIYRQLIESAARPEKSRAAAKAASPAQAHSVTVFSTPTCPWCSRLKKYLSEQRIAFKDVDVSRDARAAQEMVRKSGQMGVPQAWIDGQVVVGFDRKRIDNLLHLTASAR